MGRNVGLGLTIINQRAEEINKAILEICDLSLLMKQVGKNSLLSVKKWFEVRQLEGSNDIVASLPLLNRGECWVVGHDHKPFKVKISEKKTFHPDPNTKKEETKKMSFLKRDVGDFITKINERLTTERDKKKPPPTETKSINSLHHGKDVNQSERLRQLMDKINALNVEKAELEKMVRAWQKLAVHRGVILNKIGALTKEPEPVEISGFSDKNGKQYKVSVDIHKGVIALGGDQSLVPETKSKAELTHTHGERSVSKCGREILRFLVKYRERSFTKAQVAIATGYSAGSGGFNNALSELNIRNFIVRAGNGKLLVNTDALPEIWELFGGQVQDKEYDINTYKENLGKCEREIYQVLLDHPEQEFSKEQICAATETPYSPTSGGFNNAISRLSTLELIQRANGRIKLNEELLELL